MQEEFKTKLRAEVKMFPDKALYFFDESRFGTHSKLGHGWFKTGSRTPVKIKLGFQNFYLYSAVNPSEGKEFTLLIPRVNTVCMNSFLAAMSEQLEATTAIVVMDCAGWHRSNELIIPDNITLIYLPPYSPELNPVERLWQHLKAKVINNKIYETIDDLEKAVCNAVCNLTPTVIKSICAAPYPLT